MSKSKLANKISGRRSGKQQLLLLIAVFIILAAAILLKSSGLLAESSLSLTPPRALVPLILYGVPLIILGSLFFGFSQAKLPKDTDPLIAENDQRSYLWPLGIFTIAFAIGGTAKFDGTPTYGFTGLLFLPAFLAANPFGWTVLALLVLAIGIRLSANRQTQQTFVKYIILSKGIAIVSCLLLGAIIVRLMTTPLPKSTE